MTANIVPNKHYRLESRAQFTFVKSAAYVSFNDAAERKRKQTFLNDSISYKLP